MGLALLKSQPSISSSFIGIGFAIPDSPVMLRQRAIDEWALRSSLARRVGMGILADKAISNWFTVDARGSSEWTRVRNMIAAGSIEGMEKLSNAVLECVGHNDTEQTGKHMLEDLQLSALFICGSGDADLPEEMETYPASMRNKKGTFKMIPRNSRLACCENPEEFVDILKNWLASLT